MARDQVLKTQKELKVLENELKEAKKDKKASPVLSQSRSFEVTNFLVLFVKFR